MGLPAKRRTHTSKRERAAHFALRATSLAPCSHCRKLILPHRVCPHCGWYKGREVIHTATKLEKRSKKKDREKAAEEREASKDAKSPTSS